MVRVLTLKVARSPRKDCRSFNAGEELNIPEDEAQMLVDAGAVMRLEPEAPKPKTKSKKTTSPASHQRVVEDADKVVAPPRKQDDVEG